VNRLSVGLDQPDTSRWVGVEQASVRGAIHLSRPNYLGAIDVGGVVHPLGLRAGVVVGSVANDDEMLAWHTFEVGEQARTLESALARRKSDPPYLRLGERQS